jgi:hypothetical protein
MNRTNHVALGRCRTLVLTIDIGNSHFLKQLVVVLS